MFKINLKSYKKYKDSGVQWLGEIPMDWKLYPTKRMFRLITEAAPPNNNMELLSVYTDIGVKPRKELEERGNKATTTDYYWLVKKGDIIVNKLLAWMGAVGISEYDGVTSPAYDVLRKITDLNPYYYHYLFRNPFTHQELKRYSKGIMDVRLRLYFSEFGHIILPLPPLEIQNRIVEYLNRKSEQADTFIEKQTRLIELMKEQKKAIINNAVTKGLNPDAPMKDSGIEWLGEIPAHWEVRKIRRLTLQHKQGYYTTDEYVENGIKLIRITDIQKDGKIDFSDMPCVKISENDKKIFRIKRGDFLFARTGGVGIFGLIENDEDAVFASYLIRFRFSKDVDFDFLKFSFLSDYFITSLKNNIHGGVNQNVHAENLKEQYITLPSKNEQQQIVSHIETKTAKIDQAIEKAEKEITLVKEYLQSLIYHVVTGRLAINDE